MSRESDDLLQAKINELNSQLLMLNDPKVIASRCGMDLKDSEGTCLSLTLFTTPVEIRFPELVARDVRNGQVISMALQALLCYYMVTTTNSSLSTDLENKWVSFSDLQDGRFYNQAFQGYTGNILALPIACDINRFSEVATKMDGKKQDLGDLSYQFQVLPKVPVAVIFWKGDEEFPPNCSILFKKNVNNYLPTDACAIVGSMLAQSIIKQLKNTDN